MRVAEARRRFREKRVGPLYRGWLHLGCVSAVMLAALTGALTQVSSPISLREAVIAPAAFLLANLLEYLAHRWPMHRRLPGAGVIFERHTIEHHAFFTADEMCVESPKDFSAVLFPAAGALFFMGPIAMPLALAVGAWISPNAGWLLYATGLAYFLVYEWLHWSFHQPKGHWARKLPGVERLARLHRAHHDPGLMQRRHFNITFPIFDRVFRTG